MTRFYFTLWSRWLLRLTLCSVLLASALALLITGFIYFKQGMAELNRDVYSALYDIFKFWFAIVWNFTLLLALFRSLKYIFNECYSGYQLILRSCPNEGKSEIIPVVGYGDLMQVWRKWLMLIIWLVGAEMIVGIIFTKLFTSEIAIFDWFSIYVLYGFILVAGYFSFIILISRCKRIKVAKC